MASNKVDSQADSAADAKLDLKVVSTHKTGMLWPSDLAVMESTGRVVVCGEGTAYHPPELYIYRISPTGLELDKKIEELFDNERPLELLPIMHQGQEVLLVSCWGSEINMLDVENGQRHTVFKGTGLRLRKMCAGEAGRLYVISFGQVSYPPVQEEPAREVLELDTTSVPFTVARTLNVESPTQSLVYIPTRKYLIVRTFIESMVQAVSTETGSMVWKVKGMINGQKFDPGYMLYDPKRDVLIVSDGSSKRVLTFEPSTGTHIQTIPFPKDVHIFWDMAWYKDQMLVLHFNVDERDYNGLVSFLSIH